MLSSPQKKLVLLAIFVLGIALASVVLSWFMYGVFNPYVALRKLLGIAGFANVADAYSGKPYTDSPNPANMADTQSPALQNDNIIPADLALTLPSFADIVPSGETVDISGPLLKQRQIVDRVNKNSSLDLRGDIPNVYSETGAWLQSPYGATGVMNREIVVQNQFGLSNNNAEQSGVQNVMSSNM